MPNSAKALRYHFQHLVHLIIKWRRLRVELVWYQIKWVCVGKCGIKWV